MRVLICGLVASAAIGIAGCGSSTDGSTKADRPAKAPTSSQPTVGTAPSAVCEFKSKWGPVEAVLDTIGQPGESSAGDWATTAATMKREQAPEAIASTWNVLAAKVKFYADAKADGVTLDAARASTMPEITSIRDSMTGLFAQMCPD